MKVSSRNLTVKEQTLHHSGTGLVLVDFEAKKYGLRISGQSSTIGGIGFGERRLDVTFSPEEVAVLKRKIEQLERWNQGIFVEEGETS